MFLSVTPTAENFAMLNGVFPGLLPCIVGGMVNLNNYLGFSPWTSLT
jgi:hypothetical protein